LYYTLNTNAIHISAEYQRAHIKQHNWEIPENKARQRRTSINLRIRQNVSYFMSEFELGKSAGNPTILSTKLSQ